MAVTTTVTPTVTTNLLLLFTADFKTSYLKPRLIQLLIHIPIEMRFQDQYHPHSQRYHRHLESERRDVAPLLVHETIYITTNYKKLLRQRNLLGSFCRFQLNHRFAFHCRLVSKIISISTDNIFNRIFTGQSVVFLAFQQLQCKIK